MTDLQGNTDIEGPAGRIEAILKEPDGVVTGAAVVCHPHPLFGGTMHNKVVYRMARVFQEAKFAVLRFNFRGAGHSEGEHDGGRGEQGDLLAAMSFLETKYRDTQIWVAGFSFGASVLLRAVACDPRVTAIIAAGVPVSKYDFAEVERCSKPKLFIQGALDEYGPPEALRRFVETLDGPNELKIIAGADHFFEGHLSEFSQAVSSFVQKIRQSENI